MQKEKEDIMREKKNVCGSFGNWLFTRRGIKNNQRKNQEENSFKSDNI